MEGHHDGVAPILSFDTDKSIVVSVFVCFSLFVCYAGLVLTWKVYTSVNSTVIRTQTQLICSKRFRQREGHGTQNEINFLTTPIELRKDHFATTSSSSPSLAICISKLVQKFVSPSPRMPTCTWVLKFPPTNICLPARLAPSRIFFFHTHFFCARSNDSPLLCFGFGWLLSYWPVSGCAQSNIHN